MKDFIISDKNDTDCVNYLYDMNNIKSFDVFDIDKDIKRVNAMEIFNEITSLYGFRKFVLPFSPYKKNFNASVNKLIDNIIYIKKAYPNLINNKCIYFNQSFKDGLDLDNNAPVFLVVDEGDGRTAIPKNEFLLKTPNILVKKNGFTFLHENKDNCGDSLLFYIAMIDNMIDIMFSVLFNYTMAKYKTIRKAREAAAELDRFHFKKNPILVRLVDIIAYSPSNKLKIVTLDCFESNHEGLYCGWLEYNFKLNN